MKKSTYSQRLVEVLTSPTSNNDNTLVVKINTFLGEPTLALKGVLSQYSDVKHLVFDLRGNGGGYVSQAESMAKMFVKKGALIDRLVDKNGKKISECKQTNNPTYNFVDYGIIIDSSSASASECFTLAMRAGTDCKVFGFKSYGKGIAQNFKYFDDGSVIRYTSSYVYGPRRESEIENGVDVVCIQGTGITPDYVFKKDYTGLNLVLDYTTSIGISETAQYYFLDRLNFMFDDSYPDKYSASYHFEDAIKQYSSDLNTRYSTTVFDECFSTTGAMSKIVNDRFTMECYDFYLEYYDALTDYSIDEIIK